MVHVTVSADHDLIDRALRSDSLGGWLNLSSRAEVLFSTHYELAEKAASVIKGICQLLALSGVCRSGTFGHCRPQPAALG
jgi:hypothetical protein